MYKICFLLFYLLAGLEISAQQKDSMVQRQLIIPPEQHSSAGAKNQVVLNASGLIHVKKGDIFEIEPNVDYPARKLHFLRGVLKTLGIGALAYQANQSLHPFGGNVSKMNRQQQGAKSILPSLGIGLALSYPDFAGNKNKSNPRLHYLLYNRDSVLVSQQIVRLHKRTHLPLTSKIKQDGYLKILLTGKTGTGGHPADIVVTQQSSVKRHLTNSFLINKPMDTIASSGEVTDSIKLFPVKKLKTPGRASNANDEGFGNEDGDGDPCDPSSPNYDPYECGNGDPCDPSSPNYNPTECGSGDPCDPSSPNYDPSQCDQCNESSPYYDPSNCEDATCDPSSPNYDVDECDDQICDETSVNYDPSECEESTCDPSSPDYNVQECAEQVCDETSVNYDDEACDDGTCDSTSPNYEAAVCDALNNCPCITNLTNGPQGGVLRNENGDIIRAIGNTTDQVQYGNYTITVRTDYIYASDGTPLPVQTVLNATNILSGIVDPIAATELAYNCLGYALTNNECIIDADSTSEVNAILGISSIANAISNQTISFNFNNIQPGQILLVLNDDKTGYKHAAVYEGNGYFLTKNGMGDGFIGYQEWDLQDIEQAYIPLGGTVYGYINAPPVNNSSSNLGVDIDGYSNSATITEALNDNCECGQ